MEESPDDPEPVRTLFRAVHTIKGTAGFVNLKQLPRLAHATETLLDLARRGQLTVAGPTADVVLDAIDRLKVMVGLVTASVDGGKTFPPCAGLTDLIRRIDAVAAGNAAPPAADAPAKPQPEVATPAPVAEVPVAATASATPAAAIAATGETAAAAPAGNSATAADASVKVSTERLDRLINSVGELVITQAMLEQTATNRRDQGEALARGMAHLGKLTRELQDLAMSMRMVPVGGVFQKMARLVRDLARKSGKQIDFETQGAETELDRNLVEAIADPLVHMIRNAADHGIETPDVRLKAGKLPAGKINLRAYHQGGSVVIEIADDGKGLVKQRILNKAIERGIVRPDQQLDEAEIFALIFHAGLSTAEKVTDVSGRGVGMDVVKRNIEQLRGRIEIRSVEGHGTTFTIRLPLTLAVMDGLVVRVGTERYIVPILSVEQSERLSHDRVTTVHGRGELATVRGRLLPIIRLHRLFDVESTHTNLADGIVVIVQDEVRRCALLVDELVGRQQVVIKSLGDAVGHPRGVAGCAILGDGRVNLILDVPGLLQLSAQ